jgi:hypothetical protein
LSTVSAVGAAIADAAESLLERALLLSSAYKNMVQTQPKQDRRPMTLASIQPPTLPDMCGAWDLPVAGLLFRSESSLSSSDLLFESCSLSSSAFLKSSRFLLSSSGLLLLSCPSSDMLGFRFFWYAHEIGTFSCRPHRSDRLVGLFCQKQSFPKGSKSARACPLEREAEVGVEAGRSKSASSCSGGYLLL